MKNWVLYTWQETVILNYDRHLKRPEGTIKLCDYNNKGDNTS